MRFTTIYLLALWLALSCPAATVYVNVHDITGGAVANRTVVATLTKPTGPVVSGPWVFAGDAKAQITGADGVATFTNMMMLGEYTMYISGNPSRMYPFSVGVTNGTYNVVELLGTNNAVPLFYDASQIDAMIGPLATTNTAASVALLTGATNRVTTNLLSVVNVASNAALAYSAAATNDLNTQLLARLLAATNTASAYLLGVVADDSNAVALAGIRGTNDSEARLRALVTANSNSVASAGVRATNDIYTLLSAADAFNTNSVSTNLIAQLNAASNVLAAAGGGSVSSVTNNVTTNVLSQLNIASNLLYAAARTGTNDALVVALARAAAGTNTVQTNLLVVIGQRIGASNAAARPTVLYSADGSRTPVDGGNYILSDSQAIDALNFDSRTFIDASGNVQAGWDNGGLYGNLQRQTNFQLGAGTLFQFSTNIVWVTNAGTTAASQGTYEWVSTLGAYTNQVNGFTITNNATSTWTIRNGSGTALYSASAPAGATWTTAGGSAPAPATAFGWYLDARYFVLCGWWGGGSNTMSLFNSYSNSLQAQITSGGASTAYVNNATNDSAADYRSRVASASNVVYAAFNAGTNSLASALNTQYAYGTNWNGTNGVALLNAASNILFLAGQAGTNALYSLLNAGTNTVQTNLIAVASAMSNAVYQAGVRGTNDLFALGQLNLAAATNSVSTNLIAVVGNSYSNTAAVARINATNDLFTLLSAQSAYGTNFSGTNGVALLNAASNVLALARVNSTNALWTLVQALDAYGTNFTSTNMIALLNSASNVLALSTIANSNTAAVARANSTNDLAARLAAATTTTNLYLSSNPAFVASTNVIAVYNDGNGTNGGTYVQLATPGRWTNQLNANYIIFLTPTYYIVTPDGNQQYSTANPWTGSWAAVAGNAPAPTSSQGYTNDVNGMVVRGIAVDTNLDARLLGKVSTNQPGPIELTNTANQFAGIFTGAFNGTLNTSNSVGTNIFVASAYGARLNSDANYRGTTQVGSNDYPILQSLLDKATNRPHITVIIDGPALINSSKGLSIHSNTTVIFPNYNCGILLGASNNCPIFQNAMFNTNYSSKNIQILGGTLNGNGTNQSALMWTNTHICTAQGTNVYTSVIVMLGVSNVLIQGVHMLNPRSYAVLCAQEDLFTVQDCDWNYQFIGGCGQDGIHHVSDGGRIVLRNNSGSGVGDNNAFNMDEAGQWGKAPYWSTNINVVESVLLDGFFLYHDLATVFGGNASSVINVQTADSWSHINHLTVRNVEAKRVMSPIRGLGRVGTAVFENWNMPSVESPAGYIDFTQVTNLSVRNWFYKTVGFSGFDSPYGPFVIGNNGENFSGMTADLTSITGSGAGMFVVSGLATSSISVNNVVMTGGDGVFQNLDSQSPLIKASNIVSGGNPVNMDGGLTNIFGDSVGQQFYRTNWVSGKVYMQDFSDGNVTLYSEGVVTEAAVAGQARMDLVIDGRRAAGCGGQTLLTVTPAVTNTFPMTAIAPRGSTFYWTNLSVGAGNGVVLLPESSGLSR